MKKRLLLISLALVLVLTMLAPTPVLAKGGKWDSKWEKTKPIPFVSTAEVMVVDPGKSIQRGLKITTRGERIEGVFTAVEGWPELAGASLKVWHNSVITLSPDSETEGTFSGKARALIVVSLGNGRLFGRYTANLEGEYHLTEEGELAIDEVLDTGTFRVIGRILKDGRTFVQANGDWNAYLQLTPIPIDPGYTLAGVAQINGEYVEMSRS